jgi:hypothetical protein
MGFYPDRSELYDSITGKNWEVGSEAQPDLSAFADDSPDANIEDLAQWCALEERVLECMKKEHSERKDKLDATKEQIAKLLKAKGLKSMKLDSGLSPCRATSVKYYRKSEITEEALCDWFEANDLADNVKRVVGFQKMQSVFRERLEAGQSIPTELVDQQERDTLRMSNKAAYLAGHNVKFKATKVSLQGGKVVIQ